MAGAGAPDAAAAAAAAAKKTLIQSPTNLKEAIDWILRLTGKDGSPNTKCLCLLSEVIHDLVRDVESHLSDEELEAVRGTLVDLQGVEGTRRITELLQGVSSGLQKFIGYSDGSVEGVKEGDIGRDGIGRCGKTGGKGGCTCGGSCGKGNGTNNQKYESSYDKGSGSGTDDMSWDKIYDSCTTGSNGSGTSGTVSAGSGTSGTLETLARILLGAIPLVFSGLSYLYWISVTLHSIIVDRNQNKKKETDLPLRYYVERMGYKWDQWRCKSNQEVDLDGLPKVFEKCNVLGEKMEDDKRINYATFLDSLRGKAILDTQSVTTTTTTTTVASGQTTTDTKHSLIILNTICSGYFRSLHTLDTIRDPRPRTPRTIREILYWLTSLPYCPIYRTLVPKVQEMFRVNGGSKGSVTFYGSDVNSKDKHLDVSTSNCGSYLLGAALVAPMVLLTIQDTIDCLVPEVGGQQAEDTEGSVGIGSYKLKDYDSNVSIHDLYANMQFYFSYPMSETQSYYVLQDCLVALYYQLYFLRLQCNWNRQSKDGDCWGYCKYGEGVMCDEGVDGDGKGKGCTSWICPVGKKENHANGKSGPENTCGNGSGKASPLQAFLTDCLQGFTCPVLVGDQGGYKDNLVKLRSSGDKQGIYSDCYPEFLSHRGHTLSVFGTECAVPMGFSGSFRKDSSQCVGLGIYGALRYYTSDNASESGLYQITRCICSLTRRVPRSTGTLYGFFHGLGHVTFHAGSSKKGIEQFRNALTSEMGRCPGWRNPECLMDALMGWRGGGSGSHKQDNCLSLDSIQNCDGKGQKDQTCGKYFQPLTGSLYNSMATQFTATYLSWIIHLTCILHKGLESLLEEFKGINCKDAGCKGTGGGPCECPGNGCIPGSHGDKCCCSDVVFCAGVHGLFYRFGFSYFSPGMLTGKDNKLKQNGTRKCTQFYQQLDKVINKGLFDNLFKEIYRFLYSTRALFGVYIGVYWSIVLVYLLWSMTYNLDLIHIRSHWRSPSSHMVPVGTLLSNGSRKGFCTLGYFQDSGDRLLSLGVSDVYL